MMPRGEGMRLLSDRYIRLKKKKKIDIIYLCTLEMSKDYVKMKLVNARR